MSIRIGSNISSLQAQRQLAKAGSALTSTYEKLSSGLRINRPSDDAAGLAIATSLNASGRVFGQAIRNLNDGISMANIGESSLESLRDITIRQKELSEQAANGSYSFKQRSAMNAEAKALTDEFNRVVQSTTFNGRKLFDVNDGTTVLQAGQGANTTLTLDFTSQLARNIGTGVLDNSVATGVTGSYSVGAADFNGDGILDVVTQDGVYLGSTSGTFTRSSYDTGDYVVAVGDFNNDGKQDFASMGDKSIHYGNGDGTFQARVTLTMQTNVELDSHDVNGDGNMDLIADGTVYLNDGKGHFSNSGISFGSQVNAVSFGDFNNDGIEDAVAADKSGSANVFLGTGSGRFSQILTIPYTNARSVAAADFDGDGNLDFAVGSDDNFDLVTIYHGNGAGSFTAGETFNTYAEELVAGDLNGDGKADLFIGGEGFVLLSNANGKLAYSTSLPSFPKKGRIADFNNDGVNDVFASDGALYLNKIKKTTTVSYLDLSTRQGALAALTETDKTLQRIEGQIGVLGASTNRIDVALNNLSTLRENYAAAESRIQDVDIAGASAELVRQQILQKVAASVLAQANQAPALALQLLR